MVEVIIGIAGLVLGYIGRPHIDAALAKLKKENTNG